MHKYLITSTITALPWLYWVLKFFLMDVLKIAVHGLHMPSLDGTLAPVLNIIVAIKFESLQLIKFALDNLSLGFPTKSPLQLPLTLT